MKIAIVGIVDTFAGGTMSLINLCHSLQKFDSTNIAVFGLSSGETEGFQRIQKELANINIKIKKEPIFYFFKPKIKIVRIFVRLISLIFNIYSLIKYIKHENIDIIHTYDSYANFIGTIAAKFSGAKLVYTAHLESDIDYRFSPLRPKFLLRQADLIITTCKDYIQAGLQCRLESKKMIDIYTGIRNFGSYVENEELSFADYQLNRENGRSIVALVGRVDVQKGHELMLEAVKRNRDLFQGILILFVGDVGINTRYVERLRDIIKANDMGDIIKITGAVSSVSKLLQIVDLIILPSLYESIPMILLEAMNAGKPIVASNIGGIPELIKDDETGYLFNIDDVDSLARKISELILNPHVGERFVANGKKLLNENFSIDKMGERHMAAYRSLLMA